MAPTTRSKLTLKTKFTNTTDDPLTEEEMTNLNQFDMAVSGKKSCGGWLKRTGFSVKQVASKPKRSSSSRSAQARVFLKKLTETMSDEEENEQTLTEEGEEEKTEIPKKRSRKEKVTEKSDERENMKEKGQKVVPPRKAKRRVIEEVEEAPSEGEIKGPVTKGKLKSLSSRGHVLGRIIFRQSLENFGCVQFIKLLEVQKWDTVFSKLDEFYIEQFKFYANCVINNGVVHSKVGGVEIQFDDSLLGTILGVPSRGLEVAEVFTPPKDLFERYSTAPLPLKQVSYVPKRDMMPSHRLLFLFVISCLVPRSQRRGKACTQDLMWMAILEKNVTINLPLVMISHMSKVLTHKNHDLPYGYLISRVLEHFEVPITERQKWNPLCIIEEKTLSELGFESPKPDKTKGKQAEPGSSFPLPAERAMGSSDVNTRLTNLEKGFEKLTGLVNKVLQKLEGLED